MADDVVYGAIKDYLTTAWTACPIAWENETFVKPNPLAPWVLFEITGTMYDQESIGEGVQADNRWDMEGIIWLHVMVPRNSGSIVARQYAKALADLFRGKQLLADSLEFLECKIGEGAPGEESGTWYRVSTSVDWRRWDA